MTSWMMGPAIPAPDLAFGSMRGGCFWPCRDQTSGIGVNPFGRQCKCKAETAVSSSDFQEQTDEEHPLSAQELCGELENAAWLRSANRSMVISSCSKASALIFCTPVRPNPAIFLPRVPLKRRRCGFCSMRCRLRRLLHPKNGAARPEAGRPCELRAGCPAGGAGLYRPSH